MSQSASSRAAQMATSIIIFGASGDLTARKLMPALFNLYLKERLPGRFCVIGFAWTDWDTETFRAEMTTAIEEFVDADSYETKQWETFRDTLYYVQGSFTEPAAYEALAETLAGEEGGLCNRLFYLATSPRFFAACVAQLGQAGLVQEGDQAERTEVEAVEQGWRRVIIEKPFGSDLASAQQLNRDLHAHVAEHQIYRIDHYLAKETVQNLLVFRFANTIFEPLWNRNYIDHVQISALEEVDVARRAGYYDQAGILRDMFQNHLLQLMALTSMEPPASFDANGVRDEKVKALTSIQPIPQDKLVGQTVRAQYEGYREHDDVAADSATPTYAAIKLQIDNWRWQGVPFYLRSGKALAKKATEIIIQFKRPPYLMFKLPDDYQITSNYLAICLQPHEGMHLRFEVKVPDTDIELRSVDMEFHYENAFGEDAIPEAYERLLLDAIEGDATLFTRSDGIEAAWRIIDPIIKGFAAGAGPPVTSYEVGGWGPEAADQLLRPHDDHWRHGCAEHA